MAKGQDKSKPTKGNRSKYGSKGKGSKKFKKYDDERTSDRSSSSVENDASWYAASERLLTDAASISYGNALGLPISRPNDYGPTNYTNNVVPGVMAFEYIPSIGISNDSTSAVNNASRLAYSFVRKSNSGAKNYDHPDLMIYLLAMDQLYALHAFMIRAYGVLGLYSYRNRYYPDMLLRAMHLDPDDFRDHIADFRYFINSRTPRIASLCVPATMNYTKRHYWLNFNLFVDGTSSKAQTYLFTPRGFWKYDEQVNPSDPDHPLKNLVFTNLYSGSPGLLTYAQLTTFVDSLIEPILHSQDCGTMSGDINKAFESNIVTIAKVADDYLVQPAYSPEVLSQIENLTIYPNTNVTNKDVGQIAGINGYLTYNPTFTNARGGWGDRRILNMHKDTVTPADTMVATRLTNPVHCTGYSGGNYSYVWNSLGSEIVVAAYMYQTATSSPFYSRTALDSLFWYNTNAMSVSFMNTTCSMLSKMTMFDWHPEVRSVDETAPAAVVVSGSFLEYENYTVVDASIIDKMNDVAMLSMFAVPSTGEWTMRDNPNTGKV